MDIFIFLPFGFWMFMIFDCLRNDPERNVWIWLLLFFNVMGAVIYFFVRMWPRLSSGSTSPPVLNRWTKRNALWEAEAAVRNIGKAHQYVQLGNVLSEMGKRDDAKVAYQNAIAKEPDHLEARWGLAEIAVATKEWEAAHQELQHILDHDAEYKRGDASLLMGKVLVAQDQREAAQAHLQEDIKYWSHPEASLLLAKLQSDEGDNEVARETLETMLAKLRACPPFYYRQHQHIAKQAERRLKSLRK